MLSDWTVLLRGPDLRHIGQVDQFTRIECLPVFNGVGTWLVELPSYRLPALPQGGGVIIMRAGQVLMAGPYTSLRSVRDEGAPSGQLTLGGVSDEQVIADRVAYPVPSQPPSNQAANAYDLRTGLAETVAKAYVANNAGPAASAVRQTAGLTVEPDLARGATVTGSARFDNLADLTSSLLATSGLGWRVAWAPGALEFQVYQPADLSGLVRFSWDEGPLRKLDYLLTAPVGTREIVAGDGEGTARIFRSTGDGAAEAEWGRRIERFVDRRDTSDTALIDQEGAESLLEDAARVQFDITVTDTAKVQFGRDYTLGDVVTVVGDVTEQADVVREVHFAVAADGESIAPTIGTPNATAIPAEYLALGRLLRAIGDQARRR